MPSSEFRQFEDRFHKFGVNFQRAFQEELDKLWADFETELRAAIYEAAPDQIKVFVTDPSAIELIRTENGCQLKITGHVKAGRILIVWELGDVRAVPYEIVPRFKKALMFIGRDGEKVFASRVVIKTPIPPHRFIRLAWRRVTKKYRQRINRAVQNAARKAAGRGGV
jgi:hypothetical protein